MENDTRLLQEIFQDADRNAIGTLLIKHENDQERLQMVSNALCDEMDQHGGNKTATGLTQSVSSELMESQSSDYLTLLEIYKQLELEEVRQKEYVYQCCCCYEEECLFEDLASCPEGHLFCKTCVLKSTETAFGDGKTRFPCLAGDCDQCLHLSTLQSIIPANLFSKTLSRIQEEEVLQANIPDLVTCPFCPFATIMPNQDDKVLKCLNPDCLKESCRLCRNENHVPLKCGDGTPERTLQAINDNKKTEAVVRKCHKCGMRFVKKSGCNKMTCICGATSCYVCRKKDIGYGHFAKHKGCVLFETATIIHERNLKEVGFKMVSEGLPIQPKGTTADLRNKYGAKNPYKKPRKCLGGKVVRFKNIFCKK